MSISLKADPSGTFGEILVNGLVVAKLPVTGNAVIPGLVGTVSQSGGVPTGAVIERGSNANGEYVRFADGTQICKARYFETSSLTVTVSANTLSTANTWSFPAAFVGTVPAVQYAITNVTSTQAHTTTLSTNSSDLSSAQVAVLSNVAQTYRMSAIAIGRWY